ncbi:MAG: hypothetical protein EDM05_58205 [Leptolyngbya sp. IPPAS B-1204]
MTDQNPTPVTPAERSLGSPTASSSRVPTTPGRCLRVQLSLAGWRLQCTP